MTDLDKARECLDKLKTLEKIAWLPTSVIGETADTITSLIADVERMQAFIDDAFEMHSNLDLDVENVRQRRDPPAPEKE